MKLYAVLLSGQKVYYNSNKEDVKAFMVKNKYSYDEKIIFDFEISDFLIEKLKNLNPSFKVSHFINPSKKLLKKTTEESENYFQRNNISEPSMALLFLEDGQLAWSPSLNNLNCFYNGNSLRYLEEPKKIVLNKEAYIYIHAVFDDECDSF